MAISPQSSGSGNQSHPVDTPTENPITNARIIQAVMSNFRRDTSRLMILLLLSGQLQYNPLEKVFKVVKKTPAYPVMV
jgi:hypothetical protein